MEDRSVLSAYSIFGSPVKVCMTAVALIDGYRGSEPVYFPWFSRREGFFFSAAIYEYRLPPAPDKVFTLIRKLYLTGSVGLLLLIVPWFTRTHMPI